MNAEIIGVGKVPAFCGPDDAPARTLARELNLLGISLRVQTVAGETREGLQRAMAQALTHSDIIFVFGGMGITPDDYTREVICSGLQIPMELHSDSYQRMRAYFESIGKASPPQGAKQAAVLPQGAVVFPNLAGPAPGCAITADDQCILLLPGNPDEALPMLMTYVFPFLANFCGAVVLPRVARIYGLTEEAALNRLGDLIYSQNPVVSLYAQRGELLARVTSRANTKAQASNLCTPLLKEIVERLGDFVYGIDVDSLQAAVVTHLSHKGMRLAVAESGTGGLFTQKMNAVPGAAPVFRFGISATANRVKVQVLGITEKTIRKYGPVSDRVAVEMASGALDAGEADISVAITAHAGELPGNTPSGKKHVSLPGLVYIAVCNHENVIVKRLGLPADTDPNVIREITVMEALNLARLMLDYDPEPYHEAIPLEQALKGKIVLCGSMMASEDEEETPPSKKETRKKKEKKPREDREYLEAEEPLSLPAQAPEAATLEEAPALSLSGPEKKKNGPILGILFAVFACTFLICAGYLGWHYWKGQQNRAVYEPIASMAENLRDAADESELPDGYPEVWQPKFASLWERNNDFVGWVKVDGTHINYPVVQTSDNDYYIKHDFDRNESKYGAPFLDSDTNLSRPSDNLILYGHNMGQYRPDDQMFGDLVLFKDPEYMKEHAVIEFHTVYEDATYLAAGIFLANTDKSPGPDNSGTPGPLFEYNRFINDETNGAVTESFGEQVRLRTMVQTGVDIEAGDQILCLSTCTYEFSDARLVLVARKVRDGEEPSIDPSAVEKNPNPMMPEVFYTKILKQEIPSEFVGMGSWSPDDVEADDAFSSSEEPLEPEEIGMWDEEDEEESDGSSSSRRDSSSSRSSESASDEESSSYSSAESSREDLSSSVADSSSSRSSSTVNRSSGSSSSGKKVPPGALKSSSSSEPSSSSAAKTPPGALKSSSSSSQDEDSSSSKLSSSFNIGIVLSSSSADSSYEASNSRSRDENQDEEEDSGSVRNTSTGGTVTVSNSGKSYTGELQEIVERAVQAEMNGISSKEALRAQAVATYTYIQYRTSRGQTPSLYLSNSVDSAVRSAVSSVFGELVTYGGKPIDATYFASSAGATNNSEDVWNSKLGYLRSVDSPESVQKTTVSLRRSEVRNRIAKNTDVTTSELESLDPDYWFDNIQYCGNGEYVKSVAIGGSDTESGNWVRANLIPELKSHAFRVEYDEDFDEFVFTVRGAGHGVGMSQRGAVEMASDGYNYREILQHYYTGTSVG